MYKWMRRQRAWQATWIARIMPQLVHRLPRGHFRDLPCNEWLCSLLVWQLLQPRPLTLTDFARPRLMNIATCTIAFIARKKIAAWPD
ncbi:MAG TPA: hypothetical protein VFL07_18420 [Rudaea sp.]|nr:hypothetical protein [Rudaea sp.]